MHYEIRRRIERRPALSTFLNIRDSEHALEQDLQTNAISLARQFAAGIGSWEELNNAATLQVRIAQVMEDRPSILGVEVYAMADGVLHFITSIDEEVQTNPAPEVLPVAQDNTPMGCYGVSIQVQIADTGLGISPEDLRRNFDPSFTTRGRHIGLGLAVCQRIVKAHKGSIEDERNRVESS